MDNLEDGDRFVLKEKKERGQFCWRSNMLKLKGVEEWKFLTISSLNLIE